MNESDDLGRALRTWLGAEGARPAPPDLLRAVAADVQARRPRPRWLALARRDGAIAAPAVSGLGGARALAFIALALLLVAIVAAALVGAGSPSPHSAVASTQPTAHAVMTVDEVTHVVTAQLLENRVGLSVVPTRITKVTLVPQNGTYDFGAGPEALDTAGATWVVEAEGTYVICSSFCDARDSETFLVGDADGLIESSRPNPSSAPYGIPSSVFRELLAAHGLQWTAAPVPASGVVSASTVVKGLDPGLFPSQGPLDPTPPRDGPMYGLVTVVDSAAAQSPGALFLFDGGTRAIWWVAAIGPIPKPGGGGYQWAAFDAVTGGQLLTGTN